MERRREQGSANKAGARQVQGGNQAGEKRRDARGKQNTENTGEQEVVTPRQKICILYVFRGELSLCIEQWFPCLPLSRHMLHH